MVPAIGQQVLTLDTNWRSPIIDFIKNNKSYPKGKEHEKLARRSSNYVVIGTKLFRHSVSSGTLCKCITQDEGVRLLSDIHSGICGNHAGASSSPRVEAPAWLPQMPEWISLRSRTPSSYEMHLHRVPEDAECLNNSVLMTT